MFLICFKQELESASHPSVCEHLLRTSKQQVSILESELAASRAEIARLRQHESKRLVPAYDSSKEEDWHGIALRLHAHLQEVVRLFCKYVLTRAVILSRHLKKDILLLNDTNT
jgi:hypothetical protein